MLEAASGDLINTRSYRAPLACRRSPTYKAKVRAYGRRCLSVCEKSIRSPASQPPRGRHPRWSQRRPDGLLAMIVLLTRAPTAKGAAFVGYHRVARAIAGECAVGDRQHARTTVVDAPAGAADFKLAVVGRNIGEEGAVGNRQPPIDVVDTAAVAAGVANPVPIRTFGAEATSSL